MRIFQVPSPELSVAHLLSTGMFFWYPFRGKENPHNERRFRHDLSAPMSSHESAGPALFGRREDALLLSHSRGLRS
jgi:hypothetical protein